MDQFNEMLASKQDLLQKIWEFSLKLLLAFLILFVGWIIAKVVRSGAIKLFKAMHIHEAAEKAGIEGFLSKGGMGFTMVTLLGQIVYWFIIFIAFLFAIDLFNLPALEQLLNPIIAFIPNIFVAVIILIFGTLFARFVQAALSGYLRNIGVPNAEIVGTIAHYAILIFTIFVAFEQLHIGGGLFMWAFIMGFGGLSLAFGIAFGLGAKDVAKHISERIYKHFQ